MFRFFKDLFSSFLSLFSNSPPSKPKEEEASEGPFENTEDKFVEIDEPSTLPKDENNLFSSSNDEIEGIQDGSA